jgi:hypothetical protein
MNRAYYCETIAAFLNEELDAIVGRLVQSSSFSVETTQVDAWHTQIKVLQKLLSPYRDRGSVHFEFGVPRLGKRIDVVAIIGPVVFVIEFKVGEDAFAAHAIDQVFDYALDLKNFHEPSHELFIAPILIATNAQSTHHCIQISSRDDRLFNPINCTETTLGIALQEVLALANGVEDIDLDAWAQGRYQPTPTIIEAATALYRGHSVTEISRSDACAINLNQTSDTITAIIRTSRAEKRKSICFVTGVPGAGKTLVGLNIATQHFDKSNELYSVFLSGNGPLVNILREALARDSVTQAAELGRKLTKTQVLSEVKAFIQNVHHFRDDCLVDEHRPPVEHVALFDEAQRAWNQLQTSKFMRQKRKKRDFQLSEPEFLISCMDRHNDWAVIVCLVGGGQEINTGEAGITEWIDALIRSFSLWHVHISSRLSDSEFGAGHVLDQIKTLPSVYFHNELHLGVSMRSFRAENVSLFIKQLLDIEETAAMHQTLGSLKERYPLVVTRDMAQAKKWLRAQARGSERYGIVASSQGYRLKPQAIDVRSPVDPIHWFLNGKQDVRSSYYLEDVVTEFDVQGLELDWVCVAWDGDFRYSKDGWEHWSFCGDRWNHIRAVERQKYLKNAYRVLLTRARQGMVIVVPPGDPHDQTRRHDFYDPTFEYLRGVGIDVL